MNADDDINEEEDLLNSNLEDELLNSGNKVVNLLDDPITDDELEMKFQQTTELRKVTPSPSCNKEIDIENYDTPEL